MGDLPIQKVSISGPTLASVLQGFSSAAGDVDGLLFGHLTRLPPPDLPDDDPSFSLPSPSSASSFSAYITGFLCFGSPMSFYDPCGRIDLPSLSRALSPERRQHGSALLGWFSGRRSSPLRPTMREHAVSVSLSKTLEILAREDGLPKNAEDLVPAAECVFLLISSSSSPNRAVHTHVYRSYVLQRTGRGPKHKSAPVDVVNLGPAFRGHYNSFAPESPFPWMLCGAGAKEEGEDHRSLNRLQRAARERPVLDGLAEGFAPERLGQLVGHRAASYTLELEELYEKMLLKLEGLASLVEKSSLRVLEQENKNLKLRSKIAGLE